MKKNTISAVANKLAILVLTFIGRRIFIVYIGVEYLGINGLFANILTLLSMADLGIGTAMNVSLYKPIAENDTNKITALLNYFKTLYIYIALAVTVVGLILTPFLRYLVNTDSEIPHLHLYYIVFVLKNAVSYLFVYKSSLLRADQKTYLINKIEVVVNFLKVALQIVVVVFLKSYFVYIVLEVAAVAAQNVTASHMADRQYNFLNNGTRLGRAERKHVFSDISSVFLYKIAWCFLNGTDNILMSVIVGTIYVGLYSNYCTITNNLETFIGLLFTALTASIGNLVATETPKKRYEVFKVMQMVSFWLCGIICVCLLFLTQDFMEIWLGRDLLLDNLTLLAIIFNVYFSMCMRPVWAFREGTGMYRQIRYIMFFTALLNLILSIILGKRLGISGIIFATSISKLATYFWYEPNILFKNFFGIKPYKYYLGYVKNVAVVLVCIALCYFPIRWVAEVSVISWIMKAAICMTVINVVYFLIYFRTPEFKFIKDKLKRNGK